MKEDNMLNEMVARYPALESCRADILQACNAIIGCYSNHGKLLLCGNGGSCADADHVVSELMKSFEKGRPVPEDLKEGLKKVSRERGAFIADNLEKWTARHFLKCTWGALFCHIQ